MCSKRERSERSGYDKICIYIYIFVYIKMVREKEERERETEGQTDRSVWWGHQRGLLPFLFISFSFSLITTLSLSLLCLRACLSVGIHYNVLDFYGHAPPYLAEHGPYGWASYPNLSFDLFTLCFLEENTKQHTLFILNFYMITCDLKCTKN